MKQLALILVSAGALGACSSAPKPDAQMAAARSMVSQAHTASQHAPQELRAAQAKLERAELAYAREDYIDARLLAEQAEVDARHALALARSERQQAAAAQVNQGIDALKQQLERRGQ